MPEKKGLALPAGGDRFAGWLIGRALVLGLLVAAAYLPALEAGFVWDDRIFIEGQPVVHDWSGLWNIWFSPADIKKEAHYWPVVYTSFWLEHKLWGLNPLGYHAVNLLLHIANVLLIWRLLGRLAVPGAWVIAAVFAIHPLHVESVAWVIERKDLLSALFYLTAALTWIRYVEAPKPARYLLVLVLFTAGLLSKSIVVTLPVALLIWHWWKSGRVTRTDLLRLAPLFGLALAITALDLSFHASREPLSLGYSFVERILIAARALWFYVAKLLWPTGLAVIYPLWEIDSADPVGWIYVLAAAALPALLWFGRDRVGRGPLAGVLFYGVTLSPVLGFVDYGYMQFSLVADRFQYLAGLGVLAVLLGAAAHSVSRIPAAVRTGAGVVLVAILAVLGTLTWRQAGIYRDDLTFFSHIVALNPEARNAHLNLIGPLWDAGRLEETLAAGRIAVAQRPDNANSHSNLAWVLIRLDRLGEAETALRTALGIDPRHRNANQNLGDVLRRRGQYEEAIERYRRVLEIDDGFVKGHGALGIALYDSGRYADAIASLDKALELEPGHSTSELALYAGRAALRLDRLDEAMRYLRRARKLRSGDPVTLVTLGEALVKAERNTEAMALYREALRIDPDFASAHVGLGAALFNLERYGEALEPLTRALRQEMDPGTAATAHYLAARTLVELDRKDEAAAQFERTLERDPDHAEALVYLAHLRFEQKKYEDALGLYRAQENLNPGSVTVLANIGVTLYFLGRHAEALESMEHVLRLDPDHQMARKMVARLRKGNP